MLFRLLPWEYAIRNLFRRPIRTALTLFGLTVVVCLVYAVAGFIRGLEQSLIVSGDADGALVFSLGMGENLEYSSIPMRTTDLVAASVAGIRNRSGQAYVSPELYLGSEITPSGSTRPAMGILRGVTPNAALVRRAVEIENGGWPEPGEILVGRLVAAKLGVALENLRVGSSLSFEGRSWKIAGIFSAGGSAFESEVWCRLDELQQALKRQDLSLVALTMNSQDDYVELSLFCRQRLDLELQALRETEYYAALQRDYGPIRRLAWLIVVLVASAGVFGGLNTMYGAVVGRIPELAMLQTIGFVRRSIVVSLIQEAMLLAATATLIATGLSLVLLDGISVRFTMSAFALRIDNECVVTGCGVGLLLGFLGAIPPAIRALRIPIVTGLKTV
jgi:putative ABC transport system permease protein